MGPTATGKTEVAVELAQRHRLEIISVDSALVYRGMDIGTAKPNRDVLAQFPHRLVDICDPSDPYSAARFRDDALAVINEIHAAGRIPLLVGGTMLYFRALLQGISPLPSSDPSVREQLAQDAATLGWAALHQRLNTLDPQAAARIHVNDPQRLIRALEVFELTGIPLSELQQRKAPGLEGQARVLKLGLIPQNRPALHARIAERFAAMLRQGFLEEVERLHSRPDLHPALPSIKSVGYRQAWQHLEGELSVDAMRERAVIATRQLAKRQFTWLRAEPALQVVDPMACESTQVAKRLNRKITTFL